MRFAAPIIKCHCQHCHGEYNFETKDFQETGRQDNLVMGQTIECPHCQEPTVAYANVTRRPVVEAPPVMGGTYTKVDQFGTGAVLQLVGCILCLIGIGGSLLVGVLGIFFLPIGLVLIIMGGLKARGLRCGACGNPIADADVRMCPVCKTHLKRA